jgi:multidrug efflux pump subunit AcrA (membrane-fusion protein)
MHPTTARPHTLRSTLAVLCVTALCVAAGLSTAQDKPAASGPKPALSVAVVTPQTTRLGQTLAANGNLAAWQEASIGAEAGGQRLAEVRVNVGERVRKGQVLAVFATDTLSAEAAQARASVAEAEAAAAEAAANAERARNLQASGALSASQINQYLTADKTALARLQAARAQSQRRRAVRATGRAFSRSRWQRPPTPPPWEPPSPPSRPSRRSRARLALAGPAVWPPRMASRAPSRARALSPPPWTLVGTLLCLRLLLATGWRGKQPPNRGDDQGNGMYVQ